MNLQQVLPWRQETTRALELEELIDQHQSMVFSIAWRMTGDRGLAEEIAQDVLLELDRNLTRIASADHARFWLRKVAMHRATDALRRRQRQEPGWEKGLWVELEERHGLVESESDSPLGTRIGALLAELPEPQRAALILRYQEEMSPDEIADTLNSPLATVKSHLQRGLKRLRILASQTLKEYIRGK
jgi:RNA polymerase sigma-70 factor (ECF subfamily)